MKYTNETYYNKIVQIIPFLIRYEEVQVVQKCFAQFLEVKNKVETLYKSEHKLSK